MQRPSAIQFAGASSTLSQALSAAVVDIDCHRNVFLIRDINGMTVDRLSAFVCASQCRCLWIKLKGIIELWSSTWLQLTVSCAFHCQQLTVSVSQFRQLPHFCFFLWRLVPSHWLPGTNGIRATCHTKILLTTRINTKNTERIDTTDPLLANYALFNQLLLSIAASFLQSFFGKLLPSFGR